MGAGQGRGNLSFEGFTKVVALLHRPMARHQHMEIDETAGSRHAGAQGMEGDVGPSMVFQQCLQLPMFSLWQGPIQQA